MEQLSFIDAELSKETRRKVEKLLSCYRNIDALIKSMEQDLPQTKLTPNYTPSESQRDNQFHSTVENIVLVRDKLHQKRILKCKLDSIYDSLRENQQKIWVQRYIVGRFDDIIIEDLKISRRQYYREKEAILKIVAEAFYLL